MHRAPAFAFLVLAIALFSAAAAAECDVAGNVTGFLRVGETKMYVAGGLDYEITLLSVDATSQGAPQAQFRVNGETISVTGLCSAGRLASGAIIVPVLIANGSVRFVLSLNLPCADTDGGSNQWVKGRMIGVYSDERGIRYGTWADHCASSDLLIEYSCSTPAYGRTDAISCQHGCLDGACLREGTTTYNLTADYAYATLTADDELLVKGIMPPGAMGKYKRISESTLVQLDLSKALVLVVYNRSALIIVGWQAEAAKVAEANRLQAALLASQVPAQVMLDNQIVLPVELKLLHRFCSDSDGADYGVRGNVTTDEGMSEDYCEENQRRVASCSDCTLHEFFCYGSTGVETWYTCGRCVDGACISLPVPTTAPVPAPAPELAPPRAAPENKTFAAAPIPEPPAAGACIGCREDGVCLAVGARDTMRFCSSDGSMRLQHDGGESCAREYECVSGRCDTGVCASPGLFIKVRLWFERVLDD
jgi:hypothetical protein